MPTKITIGSSFSSFKTLGVGAIFTIGIVLTAAPVQKKHALKIKTQIKDEFHLSESQMKKAEQMVKTDTISWQEILKALRINKTVKKI